MDAAERQKPAPGELFVDHVSHFVADLDAAARLMESMGLKVTPVSVQKTHEGPVGASNRCVMLEDGYIELLSPTHDTPAAQRLRAQMARYTGVHLACFGTPDADAEHRRLAAHGFESTLVEFERAVEGGMARFKAVRVPPEKMPEGRIQYVEHLAPEHVWLDGFTNELRLDEVYVVASDAVEAAARWARFGGLIPTREHDVVRLKTARGSIVIGSQDAIRTILGRSAVAPGIAGYSLRCGHPRTLVERCKAAGFAVRKIGERHAASLPDSVGGTVLFG
jgi:hypothetical protein